MKYFLKILIVFVFSFLINSAFAQIQNLILNGGFEDNFNNWSSPAILENTIKYSGNHSAKFTNAQGMIRQVVDVEPNTDYKTTFWIYLDPAFSGNDWGGALVEITDYNWNPIGSSDFITPLSRPTGRWHAFAVHFNSGNSSSVRLSAGYFGGAGWNAAFYVDEIKLFKKEPINLKPIITSFNVDPLTGNAPLTVNMSIAGNDEDGIVEGYYFQTSDGSYYEGETAAHTFYHQGNFNVTGIIKDDDNEYTSSTISIIVTGSQQPEIQITSPFSGNYFETDLSEILIEGNVSGSFSELVWYNEKNYQSGNPQLSSNNFAFTLPLTPGNNDVILQAKLSDNTFIQKHFTVYRYINSYAGPEVSNITFSSNNVNTFEKVEIEFELNTIADNYWFPYEQNLPPNLNTGNGVSVDCIFSNGAKTISFPAFYDMSYERFNDYLLPVGKCKWKVRASFDEIGQYSVSLRATDSVGTKQYSIGNINVTSSDNKGFIKVSEQNNKYFEYLDGSAFFGMGFNDGTDLPVSTEEKVSTYSENGINLLRVWLSSQSQFSDPWCAWATHHQMTNNGYMNPPLYGFNKKYKNGDFSIRIAAPVIDNVNTPAVFRGFSDGATFIKPNTGYRFTMRVKLENVNGSSGGFSIKLAGWGGTEITNLNVGERIYGPITGSTDWILAIADYTSGNTETRLPNVYSVLEGNVTGEVFIDMITLQEIYSDGSLSDNIMSKWSTNPHYYMDPIRPMYFDYLIDQATNKNVHFKVVILEKDDYLLNRFDASGFPTNYNGNFNAPEGSKVRKLYEYYWRNLIARWGYSDAIHSYELVNEGAPGSYYELVNDFSDYFDQHSPYHTLTSTSFWASWVPEYWNTSGSDYGDVHAYAMTTGFLDNGNFLNQNYNREQMKNDPAALSYIYSKYIGSDPLRNKPIIIGETDFDTPGNQSPDPDLTLDTEGLWLRGYLWGHLNDGGVTGLFWNPANLRDNDLYHVYKPFSRFVSNIPFNKYNFKDADVNISNSNVRGWGISDQTGNQVYFYSSHKDYYWRKVLDSGLPQTVSSDFTFRKINPGPYKITIFDTNTGEEVYILTQTVGSDSLLTLSNVLINHDAAISLVNTDVVKANDEIKIPNEFTLFQNYPNPFNPATTIKYQISSNSYVSLKVFDILGKEIATLVNEEKPMGTYEVEFNARKFTSGVYFYQLKAGHYHETKKMILLK